MMGLVILLGERYWNSLSVFHMMIQGKCGQLQTKGVLAGHTLLAH